MGGLVAHDLSEVHRGARHRVLRGPLRPGAEPVVVKTLLPGRPADELLAENLRREHELLARLALPGVTRTLGLDALDGAPALILADAGTQTLAAWLHRRPVTPEIFLSLAIQLTEVMVRLHQRGVIHRAIDPTNVMVGPSDRLTLIDFGAATVIADQAGAQARMTGSLPYMAPEETGRMNRLVDQRADLYALGALFYELLTGAPPFSTSDPMEMVHAHLARAPVPPARVNAAVPEILSALTLRLLAKVPERRYQSAEALLVDLREASRRREGEHVGVFELGLADLARALPLPDRLYGRGRELGVLRSAWERAAAGGHEVILVNGPAGVGKSALALELRRGMQAAGRGVLLLGKFDQRGRGIPGAALGEALGALVDDLLTEPPAQREASRARLQSALGPNGRVVVELVPRLQDLLGELPPLPVLGPVETENRLQLTFESFVRALATPQRPVVLCLDDLQWADDLSLRLFRALAALSDLRHLLLVGMHRNDGEADPLPGLTVERLALAPLNLEEVLALCCDALRCQPTRGRPLAELVLDKTAGNPFFVRRLLRFLHQSEALAFDATLGTWTWDLTRIQSVAVTDNVVDLMLGALRRLPARTQEVVQCAACVGHRVPLSLLAESCGRDPHATAGAVWIAVAEGLLLPLDGPGGGSFQFAHDRVQQAAYSMIDERQRPQLHLRVARTLLRGSDSDSEGGQRPEDLFRIANQLVLAGTLAEDPAERLRFAELLLRAASKARSASSYEQALLYARKGMDLLPTDAWQARSQLTLGLHRAALEAAYVTGDRALAATLLEAALAGAESLDDKAQLYALEMRACISRADSVEALRRGIEGLRLFGIELPTEDVPAALARELADVQVNLRQRSPEELLEAPTMQGSAERACTLLLGYVVQAAYFVRPELYPFAVARMVNLSLVHGNSQDSPTAYVSYAALVQRLTGDDRLSHAFGRMATALSRRMNDPIIECRTGGVFCAVIDAACAPLRSSLTLLGELKNRGVEAGDLLNGVSCATTAIILRHHQGVPFSVLQAELDANLLLARRAKLPTEIDAVLIYRQALRCLQGLTAHPGSLNDAEFDEAAFLARPGGVSRIAVHLVRRLEIAYLLRDFARARELDAEAVGALKMVRAFVLKVEHAFYAALTLAACCDGAEPGERARLSAAIEPHRRQLATWAENCPENYAHKHRLVEAEAARVAGRDAEATALYEQAVDGAARAGFGQDEALASELAARFHRGLGHRRIASMYLSAALAGYARWGAHAKVEDLQTEWGEWSPTEGEGARRTGAAALDLAGLFSAAEAISSEVVLDRLLEKLMRVCLAIAGAERAAVLLDERDGLYLRALGSATGPTSLHRVPLDECQAMVPETVLRHAARTEEPLVIADASGPGHGGFPADPYFAARPTRSVLALSMRRQGARVGVLYLENGLATRVFTPDRVQLLRLLSAQIATSLQISRLFEGLTHEVDERTRAEKAMRFLAEASVALAGSLDYRATLAAVARLAVGALADWCVVDVFEEGEAHRVAAAHADPAKEQLLLRLRERQDRRAAPLQALEVREGGGPVLVRDAMESHMRRYLSDPEAMRLAREIGVGSSMILPLRARERLLGTMTLVSSPGGRRYDERDLALGEELARRAAMAIDNARLYREVQDAVRLRDDFLAIASHELNTPIAALQLSIEGFEEASAGSSEEVRDRLVRLISRQSRRLGTLVRELMSVAELQAGRLQVDRTLVDLSGVVRESADELGPELVRARCSLVLQAERPIEGLWDRTRLEQIVTNLLANAIRYGAGGRITVSVEESPPGTARLTIEDQGIGIEPERLRHLFARFDRAVPASHYGGLGLNLLVVRELVGALGGSISVRSSATVGSIFTVELPRGTDRPARPEPRERTPAPEPTPQPGRTS